MAVYTDGRRSELNVWFYVGHILGVWCQLRHFAPFLSPVADLYLIFSMNFVFIFIFIATNILNSKLKLPLAIYLYSLSINELERYPVQYEKYISHFQAFMYIVLFIIYKKVVLPSLPISTSDRMETRLHYRQWCFRDNAFSHDSIQKQLVFSSAWYTHHKQLLCFHYRTVVVERSAPVLIRLSCSLDHSSKVTLHSCAVKKKKSSSGEDWQNNDLIT